MSEAYETGSKGETLLRDYLERLGRKVEESDRKTFDLRVDGEYAEVKSSKAPYSKLGFIELTSNQFNALNDGLEFILFIVCNLNDPENLEVIEIPASRLLTEQPTVERKYYWYRGQLERLRSF